MDEPLAMLRSNATSFYEADGLGSVTSLTDSTAAVANSYRYDTFGNTVSVTGSVVNPYRYTARDYDSETSLSYYRARYDDGLTGRFASEDPLRVAGGSTNFFLYARNNPSNFTDPIGLWPSGTLVLGGATGTVATAAAAGSGTAPVFALVSGGSATGSMAGPIGVLVGVIAVVGTYDVIEGYKLCQASGVCSVPKVKPRPAGCNRKTRDECMEDYLKKKGFCWRYYGTPLYGMCRDRAKWRLDACLDGLPAPGPLDPLEWPDAPEHK